ncbi:MAG: sensor histidine kinase, partial [Bacteroidales bacterium]|nr:sensor histidine kinase [Bacteroidales bacterium]
NALNNIYALAAIDSDKTQGAIDSLSKLLRYVLYQNDDLVPVSGEISFTKSYIDLMALRLDPSRTTLTVNVENVEDDTLKVAPLMLMTLIENAFKHGVSVHSKSFIDIDIRTVDSGNGKTMRCKVANSLFPKDSTDKSGSGIGTVNLQKRLDIIYPGKYTYDVTIEDGRYSVVLEIPLQTL